MRKIISLTLVLGSTLFAGAQITSEEGHFSVTLPDAFSHAAKEQQVVPSEFGSIDTVNYVSFTDNSVAMAGASTYPDTLSEKIKDKSPGLFDNAQAGIMQNLKGTLLSTHSFEYEGLPARRVEFSAELEDQTLLGSAIFVFSGKRLYHTILMSSDANTCRSADTQTFFNSLAIVK